MRALGLTAALALGSVGFLGMGAMAAHGADLPAVLAPTALAASPDGRALYVACAAANRVLVIDPATAQVVRAFDTDERPTGLAVSADSARVYVTCAAPSSEVAVIEVATGNTMARIRAGHTAMSPVLSPDGRTLFVCDRFDDDIGVIDLGTGRETARIPVRREPVAAAITPDGRHLLVANHLHDGPADADPVAAVVSVIDVAAGRVVRELALPTGSGALNDLRISPDGRYAVVTHLVARFHMPATQLERGWMNTNAETILDLADLTVVNTVLLDSVDRGAANPWGVAWSPDGRFQVVAHAGTHEVSVIDFPALLARLALLSTRSDPNRNGELVGASRVRSDVPNDLSFLVGLQQRVRLPEADRGPRAVAVLGGRVYIANYFSDSLSRIELAAPARLEASVPLGTGAEPGEVRRGELYFHDATLCFQGWQSCASCHPGDGRVDALNWDLLNDGLGNPKNNKSLLLAHATPPAMSLGVRETAEVAVRAGIRHSLFTVQPEEVPRAIDAYLKSLQPVPSPHLRDGQLSEAARRGLRIFANERVGCARCHPDGLFTDLQRHDVGTRGRFDGEDDLFDTPTLVESWRTAPYLHDGSAANLRDVFRSRNAEDRHGHTSHLKPPELDDLIAYVLSL